MKLLLRNIIFFLSTLNLGAQNSPATNPYDLHQPDFQNLIPFSNDQLEKIKEHGIVRVEETWAPKADSSTKTTYHFNHLGHLTHQETTDQFLDSSAVIDSTHYVYDNNGRLILKKMNGRFYSSYDSLAYDSKSQVIYYDSSYELKYEDTVENEVIFKLRPRDTTSDTIILVDLFDPAFPTEYHYHDHSLVKIKDFGRTDSIVISQDNSVEQKKTYWFKNQRMPEFRIGMTEIYRDKLLTTKSIFEMYGQNNLNEIIKYYYSPKNELIQIIKPSVQTFFTYNSLGLIDSKIEKRGTDLRLTDFKYYYAEKRKEKSSR